MLNIPEILNLFYQYVVICLLEYTIIRVSKYTHEKEGSVGSGVQTNQPHKEIDEHVAYTRVAGSTDTVYSPLTLHVFQKS